MKKSLSIVVLFLLARIIIAQPGAIDLTFNPGDPGYDQGAGPNDWVFTMVKQTDGKILIGGLFTEYNGVSRNGIARLNHNGTLDPTFDPGSGFEAFSTTYNIEAIEILPDGKILAGGRFNRYNGTDINSLVRLHPDGTLDVSFEINTGLDDYVTSLCLQTDGKILVGGSFYQFNKDAISRIVRFLPNGELDTTFIPAAINDLIYSIALDSEERILIGGRFDSAGGINSHRLARLKTDGSVDTSFVAAFPGPGPFYGGQPPCIYTVSVTPDNQILVSGYLISYGGEEVGSMVRLHANGNLDDDFQYPAIGTGFLTSIYSHTLLSNGNYAIAGNFRTSGDFECNGLAIIHPDGSFYTPFQADLSNTHLLTVVEQDNGNLLAGGQFRTGSGIISNNGVFRFTEEGSLDLTFNEVSGADKTVSASFVQNDGKIIIGGKFRIYNGLYRSYVARLHPDGSTDTTFHPGDGFHLSMLNSVATQDDGKVLVAGAFSNFNGFPARGFVRLNNDGSVDTGFNVSSNSLFAFSVALQADGKIVLAGSIAGYNGYPAKGIVRLNTDGSVDEDFQTLEGVNGIIYNVVFQPDGKMIVVGAFSMFNNTPRNGIARLNSDGSLDTVFDPGSGSDGGTIHAAALQSDGKIVIGGSFTTFNSVASNRIARLNGDGSLDDGFDPGTGADGSVTNIMIQQNGKIVIGGDFTSYNAQQAAHIARLNPDGSHDHDFITGSGFNHTVHTLSQQANGDIIAGGDFTAYNGTGRNRIARISGSGPEGTRMPFQAGIWSVYPNPSKGSMTVGTDRPALLSSLRVFDLHGRLVMDVRNLNHNQYDLDISRLQPGVYILEATDSKTISVVKIIRQ